MNENSLNSIIDSASSILILLPTKPYFDQVAAALGLFWAIRDKKETSISCPTPMVVEFNRLVGVNKITGEVGNKNLSMHFAGYEASNIERVSYDIENGEFKLTVIPKPGMPSPKKEQVEFSFSGVAADCVILIGGGNETHFPQLSSPDLAGVKLIHIGTRALSISNEKPVLSFAKMGSSTSEVVASLITQSGYSFDPDIATNLLMGIEEGSREFKGQDVTAETFELIAQLLRAGGRRVVAGGRIDRSVFPAGSIPGEIPGEVLSSAEPEQKETPQDWLEPKIFKGTSVS